MNVTIHPTLNQESDCHNIESGDGNDQVDHDPGPLPDGLVENSLGLFPLQSPLRKFAIKLISSPNFDNFILVAILLNSIAIGSVDYKYIDDNYQPSTELSVRNNIIEKTEVLFTVIFTAECLLKSIACGFMKGKHAYVRDRWNALDFLIVVVSILGLLPGSLNFSVLRSFRVLRPLRSVSKLPSLRKIISAFIESLEDLANVMILLVFLLTCFALFGVTFWRGLYHMRCRLTPFPVRMPANCRSVDDECWNEFLLSAVTNPDAHRCLPYANDDVVSWTQATSPWFSLGPQDCIWPIDDSDTRICSRTGRGLHSCTRSVSFIGKEILRTCGSNYDAFGNPRFINSREPHGLPRMNSDVFIGDLNWGFTNFDNFLYALVTTFQVVTMEGWSDVMYRTIDAWLVAPSIIMFAMLIVLGGQIVMNIVLAVISGSLDHIENGSEEEQVLQEKHEMRKSSEERGQISIRSFVSRNVREFIESKYYSDFIFVAIFSNTIVLSLDHFGISPELQAILDMGNFVVTIIFLVDMVLCNISYGIRAYWSTSSSRFDGVIALSSVVELFATRASSEDGNGKSVMSVFRSLRLIRLFKMIKQWKSLHSLLNTMGRAAADVRSFGVLLALLIFIYSLVGMQLFSNRLHFDEVTGAHVEVTEANYRGAVIPLSNFDDLFWSVTTVFQVLSGENWNEVMYDCWKATSWVAPAYFISLCILGVFIVLNLFLAILLKAFEGSDSFVVGSQIHPEEDDLNESRTKTAKRRIICALTFCKDKVVRHIGLQGCNRKKYSSIRKSCATIVEGKRFEAMVTMAIVLSSATLALDSPLADPHTPIATALHVLNFLFTTVFIAECIVKVVAYGPLKYIQDAWNVLDFAAVIASILDLSNVRGGKSLRILRTLRVLRPLKMIKRFPEIKVVVDALLLTIPSVVNVAVVCAVFFLVFSVFGVTFLKGTFYQCLESSLSSEEVHLVTYPRPFGDLNATELSWLDDKLENCGASDWDPDKVPTSREICDCLANGVWVQTIPQNFDNALNGIALLFEISTTEGWLDVMHAAIDQRGVDMQPIRGNNRWWALFFILFLILGAFFILELFVGVIIENFARIRESKGHGLMTESQRQWAATQSFVMKIKPEIKINRPVGELRSRCYDFVMPSTNPWFDRCIVAIIIANCISISFVTFNDSEDKSLVLENLNEVFSSIFIIEALLKIVALGTNYFRDVWNRFDFGVAFGLIIGFVLREVISDERITSSISSMVSLIRIGRLIRLIRLVRQLRAPLNTLITVIPGMVNIGALLLLLFFIYAVCGVQLYGMIAFQGLLNEQANFRTVGNAMLLLLRFSTGENWNGFMWSLLEEREMCEEEPTYNESPWCLEDKNYPDCTEVNGCSAGMSVFIYFYSFTLVVSFVALNLFVTVVLDAFDQAQEGEILQPSDLHNFACVWAEFDPYATGYVNASDVERLLAKLPPPLGIGDHSRRDIFMGDPCLMDIPVNDVRQVNIVDVARHLAKRLAKELQGDEFRELNDDHPVQRLFRRPRDGTMTLRDIHKAKQKIKEVVRLYKLRKEAQKAYCELP